MTTSIWKKYGFAWVTLTFFVISLILHWLFGWFAFINEQAGHQQPVEAAAYAVEMARDTFENWQSEFLQLIWQVVGLSVLFYIGSSQSKESDERLEAKIDALFEHLDPVAGKAAIAKINEKYENPD